MNRKYPAEAVGTFCLVFAGTGSVIVNQVTGGQLGVVGIGLVFGLVVLAMIYSVGHISGAHLNPAVTVGFYSVGRHPGREVLPYILAQLFGAVLASGALRIIFYGAQTNLGVTVPTGLPLQSLALEFFLTFILMFVILGVATGDRVEGVMAGVAIGATIALEAIFAGPICGASMNPARSFAPALLTRTFTAQWIYWAGPLLGGFAGARGFKTLAGPL